MKLDDAYTNGAYIPQADSFPPRWAAEAEAFRSARAAQSDLAVAYGDSPRQLYDVFLPDGASEGTLVFVHGGYWLKFDRSLWSHLAAGALARNWTVAMLQYDLCPQVRISDITRQVVQAIAHLGAHHAGQLSLSGHSAGGHLVSRMLAPGLLPLDFLDCGDTVCFRHGQVH